MATDPAPEEQLPPAQANAPARPPNFAAPEAAASVYRHASDEAKSAISVATEAYVAQMPHNRDQPSQHGFTGALNPPAATHFPEPTPELAASTTTEANSTDKTGVPPSLGQAVAGTLSPRRVDATGQPLTTNHGFRITDQQHSLKAGLRGPSPLEDFILREKLTHFDHERIPERIVHPRGSGAHGVFESYDDFSALTRAAPFAHAGKATPVFVRFSTVAGKRGSTDTAPCTRLRGHVLLGRRRLGPRRKQHTRVIHSGCDEISGPHPRGEARTAQRHAAGCISARHVVGLRVDTARVDAHAALGDVGPRHSAQLPDDARVRRNHISPHQCRPCRPLRQVPLVTDAGNTLAGLGRGGAAQWCRPDFQRRDLWDAIEAGAYPSWELGFQTFTEEDDDLYSFDVLDATTLVAEELVTVAPIGRIKCASYHLWLDWRWTAPWLARQLVDFGPGILYAQYQMQSGLTGINAIRI